MKRISLVLFPLAVAIPLAGAGSACSLTELGIPMVGDASTGDVTAPIDSGPLTNWCATTGAGHDFCADFDSSLRGTEPGAWCNAVPTGAGCGATEMGGTVTRDTAASTSSPASASSKTTLTPPVSQAFLTRDFPGNVKPAKLAFDLQLDSVGTGNSATLAAITIETGHVLSLLATPPGDAGANAGLVFVETRLSGPPSTTTLLLTLPLAKFVRVELDVGIAPNNVTITVDGASSSALPIDAPGTAEGRSVQLGLQTNPADALELHLDDVTFDFTK